MAAETWIHRADVGHALGQHPQLTPDRGMDCLHWSAMIREQIAARMVAAPDAIDCVALDSDDLVTVGPAPARAEVRGSAASSDQAAGWELGE